MITNRWGVQANDPNDDSRPDSYNHAPMMQAFDNWLSKIEVLIVRFGLERK